MKCPRFGYPSGRSPQNPLKVPIVEKKFNDVKLKYRLNEKNTSSSSGICLSEMTLLLGCFKANEIKNFQHCFDVTKGLLKSNDEGKKKRISYSDINKLFKRFS
ncbi:28S ribosomal protein, putative [Pediculus humanus corporis]|uniref:28S ribosomal protein, putative n=1 Tax=Pediculus humanus subsp. corporis TaxID=121224 RepID=E0VCW1_PEDHC|nr:28S ribosomal protein, putative [Pediculus humanus corporis]EEB11217.1 28S ribosomal protein, putative [Pediculus humanus corporis]